MKSIWWIFLFLVIPGLVQADAKRYISKKDQFSIQPPVFYGKPTIQKEKDDFSLCLLMHDECGDFFCFKRYNLDFSADDSDLPGVSLFIENLVKNLYPGAEMLKSEVLKLNGKKSAFYALFNIPENSNLMDTKTQKRRDAKRGYITFVEGNHHILLGYQSTFNFLEKTSCFIMANSKFMEEDENVYEKYRSILTDVAASYKTGRGSKLF